VAEYLIDNRKAIGSNPFKLIAFYEYLGNFILDFLSQKLNKYKK
jgi:hypothetical protein